MSWVNGHRVPGNREAALSVSTELKGLKFVSNPDSGCPRAAALPPRPVAYRGHQQGANGMDGGSVSHWSGTAEPRPECRHGSQEQAGGSSQEQRGSQTAGGSRASSHRPRGTYRALENPRIPKQPWRTLVKPREPQRIPEDPRKPWGDPGEPWRTPEDHGEV